MRIVETTLAKLAARGIARLIDYRGDAREILRLVINISRIYQANGDLGVVNVHLR